MNSRFITPRATPLDIGAGENPIGRVAITVP